METATNRAKKEPKLGRGRPSEITKERVAELCHCIRVAGSIELACDYLGISRQTPWHWTKKGREVEELIEKESDEGKRPVLTEKDQAYLDFFNKVTQASAQFELRHVSLVSAAAGRINPQTGQAEPKDWRAAWAMLTAHNRKRYGEPRDNTPKPASLIEQTQAQIEESVSEHLNGSAELVDNDPYRRVINIMRTLVKADILPADVFTAISNNGNGAANGVIKDDEP